MQPINRLNDSKEVGPYVIHTPDVTQSDSDFNKGYYALQNIMPEATHDFPYVVAIDHKVDISQKHGYSYITKDSIFVWVCRVQFPDIERTQLLSNNFYVPENAKMYIYSIAGKMLHTPITSSSNNPNKGFNTGPISSNDFIIEYNEKLLPNGTLKGCFDFENISLFFKRRGDAGSALPCHNNVNCNPWHDELCHQIRSTVQLIIHASYDEGPNIGGGISFLCSGGVMNNSNGDLRPLILSARHCQENGSLNGNHYIVDHPEQWVAIYNFQSPVCTPTTQGNDQMRTVGMSVLGTHWCSDLLALEVTDNAGLFPQIPIQYNYFMNAWHLLDLDNGSKLFTIHHPNGDLKKVTEGTKALTLVPCHIRMNQTSGIIEGGSSGGPLFDESHFVIGALSFGQSQDDHCTDDHAFYGKLNSANRDVLQPLDNDEEEVVALDGIDPIAACLDHIDIFKDLYPGASWLATQNRITIQANKTISVAPNFIQTDIRNDFGAPGSVQTSGITHSDYVFRAGESITFFPGFSINNPAKAKGTDNVLSAQIGSCLQFDLCGFNYNKRELEMTHTDSILNSDSIIQKADKYGVVKYFRKVKAKHIDFQLQIFPNPTNGSFTILYNNSSGYTKPMLLYNALGEEVYNTKWNNETSKTLDLSYLTKGIYFLRLGQESQRIVIE